MYNYNRCYRGAPRYPGACTRQLSGYRRQGPNDVDFWIDLRDYAPYYDSINGTYYVPRNAVRPYQRSAADNWFYNRMFGH